MKVTVSFYEGPPDAIVETKLIYFKREWITEGPPIRMTARMVEFMNRIHFAIEDLKKRNQASNKDRKKEDNETI